MTSISLTLLHGYILTWPTPSTVWVRLNLAKHYKYHRIYERSLYHLKKSPSCTYFHLEMYLTPPRACLILSLAQALITFSFRVKELQGGARLCLSHSLPSTVDPPFSPPSHLACLLMSSLSARDLNRSRRLVRSQDIHYPGYEDWLRG